MRLSEFIRKAKDVISSPSRWGKASLHGGGSHCVLGALEVAAEKPYSGASYPLSYTPEMVGALEIMNEVISGHEKWHARTRRYSTDRYRYPAYFNDGDETTHEEIMQLFEESARRAEIKENEANNTNIEPASTDH